MCAVPRSQPSPACAARLPTPYIPALSYPRLQIPSDAVPFNEIPEMKAREICEAGKEALRSRKFDQVRINFAK